MLVHQEITCLKGEAAIWGARLLSVSRQVGARLWHEGPAGGLQRDVSPQLLKTCVSRGVGSTTEPSPIPSQSRTLVFMHNQTVPGCPGVSVTSPLVFSAVHKPYYTVLEPQSIVCLFV